MKPIIFIILILAVAAPAFAGNSTCRVTVLGPARSYHIPHYDRLNECHLQSFGLSAQKTTPWGFDVGGLAYHLEPDSLNGQANMVGGIVYKDFFEYDILRAGAGVFGGYVSKTDYHGPAVSPYVELGYGPLMFMIGYVPPAKDVSTSEIIGIGGLVFRF